VVKKLIARIYVIFLLPVFEKSVIFNTYVYFTMKVDRTENIKYSIKYKNKMQTTDY